MTTQVHQFDDLVKADKVAVRKHLTYMREEKGVVSLTAYLPVLGSVTITAKGEIFTV